MGKLKKEDRTQKTFQVMDVSNFRFLHRGGATVNLDFRPQGPQKLGPKKKYQGISLKRTFRISKSFCQFRPSRGGNGGSKLKKGGFLQKFHLFRPLVGYE